MECSSSSLPTSVTSGDVIATTTSSTSVVNQTITPLDVLQEEQTPFYKLFPSAVALQKELTAEKEKHAKTHSALAKAVETNKNSNLKISLMKNKINRCDKYLKRLYEDVESKDKLLSELRSENEKLRQNVPFKLPWELPMRIEVEKTEEGNKTVYCLSHAPAIPCTTPTQTPQTPPRSSSCRQPLNTPAKK